MVNCFQEFNFSFTSKTQFFKFPSGNQESTFRRADSLIIGIDGAIQAAEYQAVKHCIHLYGTSDIDWEVGPDTPKDQLSITSDSLTLSGRCKDL